MGRKKKFEEGTANAFRYKKKISKITCADAEALMTEIDSIYQSYKDKWDVAESREQRDAIEKEYLSKVKDDIKRIKQVGKEYWELEYGLMGIISDVFYNMKYTQMINKRKSDYKPKIRRTKNEY